MDLLGWFDDYTLRTVALGSAVLGVVSGVLGAFAVLRRQSLLGDAISHAALPGITVAFLFTRSKTPIVLMAGAAVAGWLGAEIMRTIVRQTRVKQDAALGLVLSVFFGVGLVLLTFIQRLPDASQAGLDTFLFGQAAAMLERDVITMAVLGGIAIVAVIALWKEFKIVSFDPAFAASIGIPVTGAEVLLTTLLVIAIVIGLQTVGVVLMSAMVVAPGAAARQWTDHLGGMVLLAALFGAASGVAGAMISSRVDQLPTGPTIVLCVSALVLVSLAFSPSRGLVSKALRDRRNRRRFRDEALLVDLYLLSLQHADDHAHTADAVGALRPHFGDVTPNLKALEGRGLVKELDGRGWLLTERGLDTARELTPTQQERAVSLGSSTR